ncbi:MAG: hypothetical protein HY964_03190 [Ignavibacteriales bacterium]|nr:hypothetical protein [Ignavibacteriales bacterium]
MKMNSTFWLLFILLLPFSLQAQEEKKDFGIKFSGFVKSDFFYDTRQTVNIREGHFLLYPDGEKLDADGNDINAKHNFNFLSIQTRLTGTITAPDAFGANVSGVVEADFFGNENTSFADVNGFRLRHAYAKLTWTNTELLFGQYWHPLFIPGCFSDVISFNTGAPFQPFSRNPQMRITQKIENFKLIGVLSAQRDFTSPGGSASLRNSGLPEMHAEFQYENKNVEANEEILAGIGGGYKVLLPLMNTEKSNNKYLTDETVSSISATGFLKLKIKDITYKMQGVYGENLYDMTMLGGYGVQEVIDTNKNTVAYTPFKTLSIWSEVMTQVDDFQFGLWGGYTQNLGAKNSIVYYSNKVNGTDVTIRGSDIKSIWRISPRAILTSGKFNFALETEYTNAAYAIKNGNGDPKRDSKGYITETKNLSNLRFLFAVILKF